MKKEEIIIEIIKFFWEIGYAMLLYGKSMATGIIIALYSRFFLDNSLNWFATIILIMGIIKGFLTLCGYHINYRGRILNLHKE